jgi:hypothetical protein
VQHVGEEAGARLPAAEKVDDLSAEDREEIGFQAVLVAEARQVLEERDERFLDEVFGFGLAVEAPAREREQPALISADELRPAVGIAPCGSVR